VAPSKQSHQAPSYFDSAKPIVKNPNNKQQKPLSNNTHSKKDWENWAEKQFNKRYQDSEPTYQHPGTNTIGRQMYGQPNVGEKPECEYKSVMTKADYEACGLNPP